MTRIAPCGFENACSKAPAPPGDRPRRVELDDPALLVEDAQHGRLAADERQRRHADVDLAAVDGQGHAPVLRRAALGDVQLGHDLDARDDAGHHLARDPRRVGEHAVDAVADEDLARAGLEVDVGGALLDALPHDGVHELDDRRVVGRLAQVADVELVAGVVGVLEVDVVELVQAPDERHDVLSRRRRGAHVEARHERDVVDGEDVARVAHGHEDRAVVDEPDRDRLVAAGGRGGQEVGGRHVDGEGGEVDVVDPEAVGDDARQLVGGQDAVLDQDLPGAAARLTGLGDRVLDPRTVGEAEVDDHVADEAVGSGAGGRRRHAAGRRDGDDCRGHAPDIGRAAPG